MLLRNLYKKKYNIQWIFEDYKDLLSQVLDVDDIVINFLFIERDQTL